MKVIVVGGGAAGMMAAFWAAKEGDDVILLEQNEKLGKKLFITGKGRCNVTNACGIEELLDHVVTNKEFLYSGFYSFSNEMVIELLEKLGCPMKIERGNRVFPLSDHSSDVIRALEQGLRQNGVEIRLNTKVKNILKDNGCAAGVRLAGGDTVKADKVIVATGGMSYPSTGSTGDGYRFARENGHHITELVPALVPLQTAGDICSRLQGLSLRNIKAVLTADGKKVYDEFGEMLFTHFGVSGPVILSASSHLKQYRGKKLELHIDWKPALSDEQLDHRILRDFQKVMNKEFKNSLDHLLPKKAIPVMIELSGIPGHKKVNEITKEERRRLLSLMKDFTLTVTGARGFKEAIITQGGIDVKEIDPGTMESKKIKGLYFAGEVLDLDAVTGGFNLQIAWSTGYLAGSNY
ncbi:MAG TPA: NAD(P)/FAD-dependent oxidoreductase [Candidatus Anaerostipes avicola]|uniref:NAD(P)/FAD-dependent oxidoreductase n=1 Tax=Anaerostipes butyraticus TaxID=645466 RepID=UPI001F8FC7C2|nr:NAD(P)/FAD-dependent oxidoreductase [Anaerostipes butyraticus]HJC83505.1 NAD(P)/FAD-dependent oxidoreductase [Candidatus Anaerostipes avicola]